MRVKNTGVAVATAAALLFGSGFVSTALADGSDAKIHCTGANACKGQSACKSANNACKGQNSCKGQGFTELTKAECDAAKAKAGK